jgi:energy-coupling factor transporter ATP-binding protein EcfA2
VARVLITGMSGAGKSTVLAALAARGHVVVDVDHDGWTLPDGSWDAPRMHALLAAHPVVAVCGTGDNQGDFPFDEVVYLLVPLTTLLGRLRSRTSNSYGRATEEQRDVARYVDEVEPLIRRTATVELDGTAPPAALADHVEALLLAR